MMRRTAQTLPLRLAAGVLVVLMATLPMAVLARECTKGNDPTCDPGFVWDAGAAACIRAKPG